MENDRKKSEGNANKYRGQVGPRDKYDMMGANQFGLLTTMGLRENHDLLDIGCGSLRAGRLFIPYLLPGRYYGIEPEQWLIDEGIKKELGQDILSVKKPTFINDENFTLSVFNKKFDYIIAHSIFSHACPKQIKVCFAEADKIMKANTLFFATFCEGTENYEGDAWVYPRGITYTFEKMKSFGAGHEFAFKKITWPHPNLQTWFLIYKKENKLLEGNFHPGTMMRSVLEKSFQERVAVLQQKLHAAEEKLKERRGGKHIASFFKNIIKY